MRTLSSIDSFILRRARLFEQMRRQGGGIAIIPSAPERPRNSDAHHPYRHDSDFYYFTGFTELQAWLVLIAGANDRALVFCRRKDSAEKTWEGLRHGPEAADMNHREQFQTWLMSACRQERGGRQAPTRLRDISPWLAEMRLIKDAGEIATMRHAAKISAGAHARAMLACRVGMLEYELKAELL